MITKNIGMLLLAIYLIAVGILTLTGLGIGISLVCWRCLQESSF
jgi:hypothetical protein